MSSASSLERRMAASMSMLELKRIGGTTSAMRLLTRPQRRRRGRKGTRSSGKEEEEEKKRKREMEEKALIVLSECTSADHVICREVLGTSGEDVGRLARLTSSSNAYVAKLALRILSNCSFADAPSEETKREETLNHIERSNMLESLVDLLCQDDTYVLSTASTALGNYACEYPELRDEIRACGGIEDLTGVLQKHLTTSWLTNVENATDSIALEQTRHVVDVALAALANIVEGNRKNADTFARVNGIDAVVCVLGHICSLIKSGMRDVVSCTFRLLASCADTAVPILSRCAAAWTSEMVRAMRDTNGDEEDEDEDTAWKATALELWKRCLQSAPTESTLVSKTTLSFAVDSLRRRYGAPSTSTSTPSDALIQTAWLILGRCTRGVGQQDEGDDDMIRALCEQGGGTDVFVEVLCNAYHHDHKSLGMATFLLSRCLIRSDALPAATSRALMNLMWGESGDKDVEKARPVLALLRLLRHDDASVRKHAILCLSGLQNGPDAARRFASYNVAYRMRTMGRMGRKRNDDDKIDWIAAADSLDRFVYGELLRPEPLERAVQLLIEEEGEAKEEKRDDEIRLANDSTRERVLRAIVKSRTLCEASSRALTVEALPTIVNMLFRSPGRSAALLFLQHVEDDVKARGDDKIHDGVRVLETKDDEGGDEADVIFDVVDEETDDEGRHFAAHRRVVCRCDALRKRVRNVDKGRLVRVAGVPYRVFKAIMTFLYTDNVSLAMKPDNVLRPQTPWLMELRCVAASWGLRALAERAESALEDRVNDDTAASILHAATSRKLFGLSHVAFRYLVRNAGRAMRERDEKTVDSLLMYLSGVLFREK